MQDVLMSRQPRLQKLDILRAIALFGMIVFHFSWDLAYFGYLPTNALASGWLTMLAHCVASGFLFLSGFSLYLAHRQRINWLAFTKRMVIIVLAAILVSLATFLVIRDNFIYFGILHEIALTSMVGLLFLRTPLIVNFIVAIAVFCAPTYLAPVNNNLFLWLGLSSAPPSTFDYVPFFPWFSAGLLGLTLARCIDKFGALSLLQSGIRPAFLSRFLQVCGRHTLLIYLIHQPIIMAGFFAYSSIFPPQGASLEALRANDEEQCRAACTLGKDECARYCTCAFDELDKIGLLSHYLHGRVDVTDERVENIKRYCLIDAFPSQSQPN